MTRGRDKQPRARAAPEGGWGNGKSPRVAESRIPPPKVARALDVDHGEVKRRRIVWRFGDLDDEWTYGLSKITPEHLTDLLGKLRDFESMTIGELFTGGYPGKTYEAGTLPGPAWQRLVKIQRDDEDSVAVLRCSGEVRLYGFMRDHIFHILWWDPKHEIWPSKLKNT
jgi:hypothetical protein